MLVYQRVYPLNPWDSSIKSMGFIWFKPFKLSHFFFAPMRWRSVEWPSIRTPRWFTMKTWRTGGAWNGFCVETEAESAIEKWWYLRDTYDYTQNYYMYMIICIYKSYMYMYMCVHVHVYVYMYIYIIVYKTSNTSGWCFATWLFFTCGMMIWNANRRRLGLVPIKFEPDLLKLAAQINSW